MFDTLEIIGMIFFVFAHELGHGLAASLLNLKIVFTIRGYNPATGVIGLSKLNQTEYVFVCLGGFFMTLLFYPFFMPLFGNDVGLYLLLSVATAGSDIWKIYTKYIRKANE